MHALVPSALLFAIFANVLVLPSPTETGILSIALLAIAFLTTAQSNQKLRQS